MASESAKARVTGVKSLLKLTECASLRELGERMSEDMDPDCEILGVGLFGREGILVRVWDRGIEIPYPFELGELWATADELEDEIVALWAATEDDDDEDE